MQTSSRSRANLVAIPLVIDDLNKSHHSSPYKIFQSMTLPLFKAKLLFNINIASLSLSLSLSHSIFLFV